MLKVEVSVRHNTRAYFMAVGDRIDRGTRTVSKTFANNVKTTAQTMMDGGKSGTHWPGLPNRSSAPGEAPASQSGAGRRSIRIFANQSNYYSVGSTAWHMNFLMERRNRPLMELALEKHRAPFLRAIHAMIERSL